MIERCLNMVMKFSISAGLALHDVFPAMVVNFAFCKKVKITPACHFVSLGDQMREPLDKKGKK